jgi:hypothetical protein
MKLITFLIISQLVLIVYAAVCVKWATIAEFRANEVEATYSLMRNELEGFERTIGHNKSNAYICKRK